MNGNKQGFYKYIGKERKTRENVGPLLNKTGNLVTKVVEMDEVRNDFTDKTLLISLSLYW